MLDWAHRLALRSVARGDADDSPALRDLVAIGLVASRDGGWQITETGRLALDAGPARWERLAWSVFAIGMLVILVDTVVGWLT